jgi:hypothetical protein
MMILMSFVDDLDAMTIERLVQYGYLLQQEDTAFDRFVMLYMLTERKIPQIPYEVKCSTHLLENSKYKQLQSVLDEIISCLQNGESLGPYLSTKASEPRWQDGLLLSWGIHHLHLSSKKTKGANGFVSRIPGQSELLFLRIEGGTAYLIDIVSHSEEHRFVNPRLLEIVDRNWPELHIAPKLVTGNHFSPEQIKNLRAKGVNYAISVNGRTIFPKPVSANGVPLEVQMRYQVLCDELRNVEADVRRRFYEYFPHKAFSVSIGSLIPEARLVAIEDDYFVLREQGTMRLCHAWRKEIKIAK